MSRIFLFAALIFILAGTQARAAEQPFDMWLEAFRLEALQQGISQATVDEALSGIAPNNRVLELDRKQPEGTTTFRKYRQGVVSRDRIDRGRMMMVKYADTLNAVSAQYGVAPQYIVALWGIETGFGRNTGGFDIIPALATLAWDGRREAFFRKELMDALTIIDQGHISAASMKGSWAGAMGQNQFMPSSFLAFAVDGNGDGRKDIWGDVTDVFASTANYLARSGWADGDRWGREVRTPKDFSPTHVSTKSTRTLREWSELGVRMPDGTPLPHAPGMHASLVAPDGLPGPAYLVYANYKVIMKWNRSTYFATSVGLLADAIAGSSP